LAEIFLDSNDCYFRIKLVKPDLTFTGLGEIGIEVTSQREAILRFLNGNQTHPTAKNICSISPIEMIISIWE